MSECLHGMEAEWCGICSKVDDPVGTRRLGTYGYQGGETKQDVLNDITDLLGLPRHVVSVGSSLPSDVFNAAAARVGVAPGNMPQITEGVIRRAGLPWSASFDSRASSSGGGSTVTLEGIQALRKALQTLLS